MRTPGLVTRQATGRIASLFHLLISPKVNFREISIGFTGEAQRNSGKACFCQSEQAEEALADISLCQKAYDKAAR